MELPQWWTKYVGAIALGRFGKALKLAVEQYGWESIEVAMMRYRPHAESSGKGRLRLNGSPTISYRG